MRIERRRRRGRSRRKGEEEEETSHREGQRERNIIYPPPWPRSHARPVLILSHRSGSSTLPRLTFPPLASTRSPCLLLAGCWKCPDAGGPFPSVPRLFCVGCWMLVEPPCPRTDTLTLPFFCFHRPETRRQRNIQFGPEIPPSHPFLLLPLSVPQSKQTKT